MERRRSAKPLVLVQVQILPPNLFRNGVGQMSNGVIEENLQRIRERIHTACHSVGRNPDEVKLLLATKTVPVEKIKQAILAGETLLGENKVQELQVKHPSLGSDKVEWHFIGHLQTNKVKDVLKYVTCIHSVDRYKLGQTLHNQLTKENRTLDIFVQVNTSNEDSKFGIQPHEALSLIEQLAQFETLNIKGLMTIGKLSTDLNEARKCFRILRRVQEQIDQAKIPRVEMKALSMGMSGDLEIAIEEGATMLRVGTAIFGERIYPDSYYWNEQIDT